MSAALDGVRVLDLTTGVAGPLAAMLLADFGADVVKVEPPEGDPSRSRPGFAMFNRNKRSVIVDLAVEEDQRRLDAMLAGAHICVTGDGRAGDELTARYPALVHLHMPSYLDKAPWSGGAESNELLSAALGLSLRQSSYDGGPIDPVYQHYLYAQAVWAAAAATAAVVEQRRSGHGQQLTVGGVHGAMVAQPLQFLFSPDVAMLNTAVGPGGPSPLYSRYQCADGRWLFVAALTPKFQLAALAALGLSDLLNADGVDGRLEELLEPQRRAALRERMVSTFATRTSAQWRRSFTAADCPTALVDSRDAWLDHPQIRAIEMATTIDDPDRGEVTMPGNPIRLLVTPASIKCGAPSLGEDEAPAWSPLDPPAAAAPRPAGPLAGYRVLDLGMVLAGPYTGTLLAELGADVIRVEIPSGDPWRERGYVYMRGQSGLAVNLRSDEGRDLFLRLVEDADIVIDNFRPGVLDRLGIDHARLLAVNPRLVALSITAFGVGGPLSEEPGFDPLLQAMSGIMAAQGGDSEPVLLTLAVNDVTVAALTVLAACVALAHRDRTGEGQSGWTSLAGAAAFAQCEELIRVAGRTPAKRGGRDFAGPSAYDRFYACADGWIRVQAGEPEHVRAMEKLVGESLPPGDAECVAVLERFFQTLNRDDASSRLAEAGVPAVAARPLNELTDDPQLRRWNVFHSLPRPGEPSLFATGRWAAFSRTVNETVLLSPGVGEHTEDILRGLGFDDETIADLCARGIVRPGKPMVPVSLRAYR